MHRWLTRRWIWLGALWLLALPAAADTTTDPAYRGEKHLLYVTVPDGAGGTGRGPAIYVFDIEDGHKLLRRISVPEMRATRGACASAATGKMFISHGNTSLMCWDVVTEKVVWNVTYPKEEGGADRCCVTLDGRKVYVPEGWWSNVTRSMKVVDGETGKTLKTIPLGVGNGHNSIMSRSGQRMYMGPVGTGVLFVVDTKSDRIIKQFGPFGGRVEKDGQIKGGRVSPYTINGAETLCFVNSHDVGFYVGDLVGQKVLHWVQVKEAKGFSHGVGLTPDEKEIWLTDPEGKKLHVYDATVMPPAYRQPIDVSATTHGWVTFDLAGRFAYCDTGDVIDARSKKIVATWKDAQGGRIGSSKFIEIHFQDGKPLRIGDQFGIGRAAGPPT